MANWASREIKWKRWINGVKPKIKLIRQLFLLAGTSYPMHTALRTYNIFYLNKQQVENSLDAYARCTQRDCQTKSQSPLMLKAKATILVTLKIKKNGNN